MTQQEFNVDCKAEVLSALSSTCNQKH